MAGTQDNLKAAFAGESQANQRYHGSAKKADTDGRKMVAKIFRAAAAAETVHAQNHLLAMSGVGETIDNVKSAIDGEAYEFKKMYPDFLAAAKKEGEEQAERSFDLAMKVEKIHHELYSKALKALQAGKDLPYKNIFVCRGCGNTVEDQAPEECPICGAPKSWFMWIE
jgi:rubrerythrin